jgi:hypothetical protein
MSEYEQEQFYLLLKNDFDLFNAFVLEQSGPGATSLFEEMFNNVLNTKALLLNTSNGKKNRILSSKDEALIAKLHAWEAGKAKLSASFYEKTSLNIDSLQQKLETLEKEINQRTGLFDAKATALTWNQVQSALGPNEAAAELIRINPVSGVGKLKSDSVVYALLLVRKQSAYPEITVIRQGAQLERRFLLNYRNSIMFRLEDKNSYEEFWRPIAKQLKGIERLYLSRDGVYNQINLNTGEFSVRGKGDKTRVVFLSDSAKECLQKYLDDPKCEFFISKNRKSSITNSTGGNSSLPVVVLSFDVHSLRCCACRNDNSFCFTFFFVGVDFKRMNVEVYFGDCLGNDRCPILCGLFAE